MSLTLTDVREAAILTPAEVATLVEMPTPTVYSWLRPSSSREALVHSVPADTKGWPSVPLYGLAEAHTVRSLRKLHWGMRDVGKYAEYLRSQSGDRFALASPKLVTDGIDAFEDRNGELTRLRDSQIPISEIIRPFLRELVLWDDGRTGGYRPPRLDSDLVELDPRFNGGRMSFVRGRVPLFAVVGSVLGGDTLTEAAEDYRLDRDQVALVERHFKWLEQAA